MSELNKKITGDKPRKSFNQKQAEQNAAEHFTDTTLFEMIKGMDPFYSRTNSNDVIFLKI
mgnify:CR=1 FL=1